jgi:hypothetical protein
MKQMESRIVYHIDKYIAFLFGEKNENDLRQRIYNKLFQLECEELENFMNAKVKPYILGKYYLFNFWGDNFDEFERENFEGNNGPASFKDWYSYNIINKTGEVMDLEEIYGGILYISVYFTKEYKILKNKIQTFKNRFIYYDVDTDWRLDTITDYIEMFIMTMSSEVLKEYIIRQVDTVQLK